MIRNIHNYAFISLQLFNQVRNLSVNLLNSKELFPDQNDPDLSKLLQNAKQIITEIDNMITAMRKAKLIK